MKYTGSNIRGVQGLGMIISPKKKVLIEFFLFKRKEISWENLQICCKGNVKFFK